MQLSTRNKALFLASLLTIHYVIYHFFVAQLLGDLLYKVFIYPVSATAIMFFGMNWVLNFDVKGGRLVTISGFASINVFVLSLFFELLIFTQSILAQVTTLILSLILVFAISYVIILTMNILNLAYTENIPLVQAARAASYVISIIVSFIAFLLLFSNPINFVLRQILIFDLVAYFTFALISTLKLDKDSNLKYSLSIALTTVFFAIVISFWPISAEIISLILALILYMTIGVALEIKEKISEYIWIEYTGLFIGIFFILILLSNWGINGSII